MRLHAVPAALLLAAAAAAALLATHVASAAAIAGALLAAILRAPVRRKRVYLFGALIAGTGVVVVWPLVAVTGTHVLWDGPTVSVLGRLDVTREELAAAALQGTRLVAVALAFAAYALLLDHDELLAAVGFARRSALTAVLATRLVPTLERDALGLAEALRGRGVPVEGVRAKARLLSPLVSGSLERALTLAEAMEARGFGRPGRTRSARPPWTAADRASAAISLVLVTAGALWL